MNGDQRRKVRPHARATVLSSVVDTFAPPDADAAAASAFVAEAFARLAPHRRAKLALVLGLLSNPLAGDDGRSAVWDRLGYPGPRSDRPGAAGAAGALGATEPPERLEADAVVVGSGAGGAVAAALLAHAGMRVVVLEAGPPFGEPAGRQREGDAFAALYLEAGLAATDDLSVSLLAGACVGGGTTVNWSTSLRLPQALAARWGDALGRPAFAAELEAAYAAVEARIGVTLATSHNRNNAVIVDGCAQLGWTARTLPRNAACSGDRCGYCGFGCAYGTKQSAAVTYLRDALDAGASIYANTRSTNVGTCAIAWHRMMRCIWPRGSPRRRASRWRQARARSPRCTPTRWFCARKM